MFPQSPEKKGEEKRCLNAKTYYGLNFISKPTIAFYADLTKINTAPVPEVLKKLADLITADIGVGKVKVRYMRSGDSKGLDQSKTYVGVYLPKNIKIFPPAFRPSAQICLKYVEESGGKRPPQEILHSFLHEMCHHLDRELLLATDSNHSAGFDERFRKLRAAITLQLA